MFFLSHYTQINPKINPCKIKFVVEIAQRFLKCLNLVLKHAKLLLKLFELMSDDGLFFVILLDQRYKLRNEFRVCHNKNLH